MDVNGNSLWHVAVSTLPDSLDHKPIKDSEERKRERARKRNNIEQSDEMNEFVLNVQCSVFMEKGLK